MKIKSFLLFLILIQEACGNVCSSVTSVCSCDVNNYPPVTDVDCINLGLTTIPVIFSSETQGTVSRLSLDNNSLTILPANAFQNMRLLNVSRLQLRHNRIRTIEKNAFSNLETLEYLYLDYNELINIPGESLLPELSSLIELHVSFNQIRSLLARDFQGAGRALAVVTLNGNEIATVSPTAFVHIGTSLRGLDLRENQIAELDYCTFKILPNLRYVFLDMNPIVAARQCPCVLQWLYVNGSVKLATSFSLGFRIALECRANPLSKCSIMPDNCTSHETASLMMDRTTDINISHTTVSNIASIRIGADVTSSNTNPTTASATNEPGIISLDPHLLIVVPIIAGFCFLMLLFVGIFCISKCCGCRKADLIVHGKNKGRDESGFGGQGHGNYEDQKGQFQNDLELHEVTASHNQVCNNNYQALLRARGEGQTEGEGRSEGEVDYQFLLKSQNEGKIRVCDQDRGQGQIDVHSYSNQYESILPSDHTAHNYQSLLRGQGEGKGQEQGEVPGQGYYNQIEHEPHVSCGDLENKTYDYSYIGSKDHGIPLGQRDGSYCYVVDSIYENDIGAASLTENISHI
ncbi:leucine-rich repeat and transmembrane domain-containing protein 2 [Lingula anatina]|uniref:Leucine-rich repeat and transmembrane domain-containing protein 2 n=1 Tax=Lingula anatina TaxID=7574 RepID=A0A1S3I778_LINAN|nr:leucine-rich repeat and transmembrane domain-containing protein 2 [Lingula anatina]|eukprot:XP_013393224.1 leucine-rich repeat and transmembrane domain-containing protein 2 [Lingula anatina]